MYLHIYQTKKGLVCKLTRYDIKIEVGEYNHQGWLLISKGYFKNGKFISEHQRKEQYFIELDRNMHKRIKKDKYKKLFSRYILPLFKTIFYILLILSFIKLLLL